MVEAQRFSFQQMNSQLGSASLLAVLPLTLTYLDRSIDVSGLLLTWVHYRFKQVLKNKAELRILSKKISQPLLPCPEVSRLNPIA